MSYPEELRDYQAAGKMSELYGGEVWVWGLNCCTCWFAGVIWSELWSDLLLETSYANASLQDFLGWKKRFNVTRIMSCPSRINKKPTWQSCMKSWEATWWLRFVSNVVRSAAALPTTLCLRPKKVFINETKVFFHSCRRTDEQVAYRPGTWMMKIAENFRQEVNSPNELRTLNMKAAMLPFRIEALAIPKTHGMWIDVKMM